MMADYRSDRRILARPTIAFLIPPALAKISGARPTFQEAPHVDPRKSFACFILVEPRRRAVSPGSCSALDPPTGSLRWATEARGRCLASAVPHAGAGHVLQRPAAAGRRAHAVPLGRDRQAVSRRLRRHR